MKIYKHEIHHYRGHNCLNINSDLRPNLIHVRKNDSRLFAYVEQSESGFKTWTIELMIYYTGEELKVPFTKYVATLEHCGLILHFYTEE